MSHFAKIENNKVILIVPTLFYPGAYAPQAIIPSSTSGMTVLTYTNSGTYTA
jgi:predicted DNA repair protein MutK